MKVYVAESGYDYDATFIVGVFSTKEQAEKHLEEHYSSFGDWHEVYEMELDKGV